MKHITYPEEFKVVTYPGIKTGKYAISNYGRLFNRETKKMMKPYFDKDGHVRITLVTDKKHPTKRGNISKHYFIHRLMAWEFIGPPKDEYHNIVCHKNDNPSDNYIHNLEWGTIYSNREQAKENKKLNTIGIGSPCSIYDEKIIRKICNFLDTGVKKSDIINILLESKKYPKYSETQLYNIITKLWSRKYYRNIVVEYNFRPPISYYTCKTDLAKTIRKLIYEGNSNIEIVKKLGLNDYKDDKKIYNEIIKERMNCKVLFNDYPKEALNEILE